jgi:hypothetical protein
MLLLSLYTDHMMVNPLTLLSSCHYVLCTQGISVGDVLVTASKVAGSNVR